MIPRSVRVLNASSVAVGKKELVELRLRARRSGLWFRALSRIDRALVDLTIEVVDEVRSFRLAEALSSVMRKMRGTLESRVSRLTNEIGFSLARRLSVVAQNWGNKLARSWVSDVFFARFLAIMHLNSLQTRR